jgi:LmbE family N-acetylglucosaminyl deacetylase
MVTSRPALLCVHAHPDDEALFTAGVTQHYAELGYRVVLVTCTNGQLGFDEGSRPGSDPDHDDALTRSVRAAELQRAAPLAGFERVITFGYDDSGMMGWPQNENPNAFWQVDVEAAARTLAAICDEVGASVVVTYDENGFYGHPDHIMANRITRRAVEIAASTERLYYPIVPQSILTKFVPDAKALEVFLPAWVLDAGIGSPDELVSTTMDVRRFADRKREAIATHASQIDNGDFITLDEELFLVLFGTEYYQRGWSRHPATGDETDLFGGLS